MDINNLHRIPSYSYRIDSDKAKQLFQQTDKNSTVNQQHGDSMDISEEGRNALKEKLFTMNRLGHIGDIEKLSPMISGNNGIMNDFEKVLSELDNGSVSNDLVTKDYSQVSVNVLKARFEKEEGTRTDTFNGYVNKMASAYHLLKDRIEEKYAEPDRQKEYYVAADGKLQEMTKEKELEMLNNAYETHSRFMATSTQIWNELQDFKVQISSHSSNVKTETETAKNSVTGIKEHAYNAFMSAISEDNSKLLSQKTGSLNHVQLNLGISSSERVILNGIWDYYANMK
ncbi:MAG: hypothetical protein HFH68_00890 [Lachnospiraceae bacterium]|nr:hypothetical protein [Lachnospiraceae bacterium]